MVLRVPLRRAVVLFALLVLGAGMGWARKPPPKPLPIKLTAKMTNRFNWDLKKDNPHEDTALTNTEIIAQAKYLPNPRMQVVVGEWLVDGDLRLHNAYVNLASDHVNFRLGNQIVRWGKADEISPLDVINPEDLTWGFSRVRADRKIPIPMANLEFLSDRISFQGLFIPYSKKSIFHYTNDDWAYFAHLEKKYGPINIIENEPAQTLHDAEYGARLSLTLWRFDLAFSYLNHRRDIPSLVPFPISPPLVPGDPGTNEDLVRFSKFGFPPFIPPQPIRLQYLREERYGFEFETTLGSLGIRGDASYVSSQSFVTANLQEVRLPVITVVGGVDYSGPANSYINLSLSQTQIQDYTPRIAPTEEKSLALSGEVSIEMLKGNVKLSYLALANLTDKSYYHNPKIAVGYIPNVGVEVGMDIYGGPLYTQTGFYGNNDQAYLALKFFF